jgi:hypothetical protein
LRHIVGKRRGRAAEQRDDRKHPHVHDQDPLVGDSSIRPNARVYHPCRGPEHASPLAIPKPLPQRTRGLFSPLKNIAFFSLFHALSTAWHFLDSL